MTPATTQVSKPQGCCCPLYVMLPFLFITFNDQHPNGSNSTQRKKKCYYLNYGYSAVLQKTLNHPFFTIHDFYLPTWRKPATWAHRSGEDFTGVVLLFLWKKKWISLYFYVMWSMVSPAAEKMGQFEKWPWEVWIGKEFTQTWNEWPGLLQLFVPTHFM